MTGLFLTHFASTLYMTGVIWLVQLVHYPSFAYVDRARFVEFSIFHQRWTTYVVGPAMLVEIGTATALVLLGGGPMGLRIALLNIALILLIWAATFFLSVPCHSQLLHGYDEAVIAKLVSTNWVRTILWTVRALGLAYFFAGVAKSPGIGL